MKDRDRSNDADLMSSMFKYFYKINGDIEQDSFYKILCADYPELKLMWESFKEKIAEADIIFSHKMKKLIEEVRTQNAKP